MTKRNLNKGKNYSFQTLEKNRKNKADKKLDKKTLFIILVAATITTIVGVLMIKFFTVKLADFVLSDAQKKYFFNYNLVHKGASEIKIPARTEYLTNNGKLFSFCQSFSSVFVAIIMFIVLSKFGLKSYKKCDKDTVKNIINFFQLAVLFLGIFTFTSKVNPNNNIEKYKIEFNNPGYSQKSDSSFKNPTSVLGYVNMSDYDKKDTLLPVYESPVIKSAPNEVNNRKDLFFTNFIRNIDNINIYAEMITIILGVYIYVLKNFQKSEKQ